MMLALSIAMPLVEPRMLPLSMISPVMVLAAILMPVLAVIVPLLVTLPKKLVIAVRAMPVLVWRSRRYW